MSGVQTYWWGEFAWEWWGPIGPLPPNTLVSWRTLVPAGLVRVTREAAKWTGRVE